MDSKLFPLATAPILGQPPRQVIFFGYDIETDDKKYFAFILLALLVACSGRDIIIEGREHTERSLSNNPPLQHHQLLMGENKLHYAANGNSKNPALIIIHGTPGSWRQ